MSSGAAAGAVHWDWGTLSPYTWGLYPTHTHGSFLCSAVAGRHGAKENEQRMGLALGANCCAPWTWRWRCVGDP